MGKRYDFLFIINYDIDFVKANLPNITSEGVRGVIVHELAHAKQFVDDQMFTSHPHRSRKFRDIVHEYGATLNLRNPKLHALAVQKEDYRCYMHKHRDPKNEYLPPRWLVTYWVYACFACGYSDGVVGPKRPRCAKCGNEDPIAVHLPPSAAADFLQNAGYETKKRVPNAVITRIIVAFLKKYLRAARDKARIAEYERKYKK
jgi:predicted SprT family Zn-dependent metalloprotease